ncbi:MAG: hypothetical protein AB7I48_27825 [Planctomycetaceae bacterium]
MTDPVVEAIHKYREQYAAQFDFDITAICQDLRERQASSGHKVVSRAPRQVMTEQQRDRRAGDPVASSIDAG